MTTREKFETLLDRLSEPELEAEYKRLQRAVANEGVPDKWGDLSDWSDAVCRGTFEELDEEEAKVGFSWLRARVAQRSSASSVARVQSTPRSLRP